MPRKLSPPRHPEYFTQVIASLRFDSGERQPQTDAERAVIERMGARRLNPQTAAKLVSKFDAIPKAERVRLLGPLADAVALQEPGRTLSEAVTRGNRTDRGLSRNRPTFFGRWLERRSREGGTSGGSSAGGTTGNRGGFFERLNQNRAPNVGDRYDPEVSRDVPIYNVLYKGLYCRSETDAPWPAEDAGSDEIFVTTAVITTHQGVNFEGDAMNHPRNHTNGVYEGVDSGEERVGPVVSLWRGSTEHFSLVVTAWEHDLGDPDAYREEIESLVSKAIALAKAKNETVGEILEVLEETIVDLIDWVIGTGDDLLTTEIVTLTREQMEEIAMSQPGVGYSTNVLHHFDTTHKADGATYDVCFEIERDPPRPPHVIL